MRISVTQPGAGRSVWSGDPLCQGGDEAWKADHPRLSTSQRQEEAGSWSAWEPCEFSVEEHSLLLGAIVLIGMKYEL